MDLVESIQSNIQNGMSCDLVRVAGDGQHFEAIVVSAEFSGQNRIERHQRVYRALGDRMKAEIHALSIKAYTPEQWSEMQH